MIAMVGMREFILSELGKRDITVSSTRAVNQRDSALCRMLARLADKTADPNAPAAECIIFSKDRPVQLAALLASIRALVSPPIPIHVLYRASSLDVASIYDEVFALFPKVIARSESNFRRDLELALQALRSERMFFLVDDIIFTESTDLTQLSTFDLAHYVPSLRLGANLERCYTGKSAQPLPALQPIPEHGGLRTWDWRLGRLDWGYPMSVDGNIFRTAEVRVMASAVDYKAPNSFEQALTVFAPCFASRRGLCFEKSRLVNFANNRVQTENRNRSGSLEADELLTQWRAGLGIDWRAFHAYRNRACHEECSYPMAPRSDLFRAS